MPLNRPTLPQLRDRIASDIESRLPGTDARLRRSNLAVLGTVEAGVAHSLYGYLDSIGRQVIIDTADTDWLERWASIWGLVRTAATAAIGNVALTGVSGIVIPTGSVLQRSDGQQFATVADVTLAAGAGVASIVASVSGTLGNTVAGSMLVFTSAIAGVNAAAVVDGAGLVDGTDVETDDALRERLLFRIRRPPQGGSLSDYENWMMEVAGVTRVWVHPLYLGAGTVGIFFVRDNDATIIPDAGEVAIAQAYIDTVRPVTAAVTVFAPTPLAVNFTLHISPDNTAVRAAVQAELTDLLQREGEPGGTILLSHIREAVSISAGEVDNVVSAPAADVVAGAGYMPVMGTIAWV